MILSSRQKEVVKKIDKRGIVWWKIGEGKTRIGLAWAMKFGRGRPLIICAPGAVRQWMDEMELTGVRKLLKPVFVSSGFLSVSGETLFDYTNLSCIIVDELWMYKNHASNRSIVMRQLTKLLPSLGLSGSIMTAGNLEDLYGQAKAMNLDKILASSLTNFRTQYMIELESHYGQQGYGHYVRRFPKQTAVADIERKLYRHIDIYFPEDVREIRDIPVRVEPTPEQEKIRKKLVSTYMYEELEIKTATTLLIKLQQVSDGFLRTNKGSYLPVRSAKMQRLKELCSELFDSGERLLIWVGFRKTAELLHKELSFETGLLTGDSKFDVDAWQRGKLRATIATVGSGASLNDFANVRYAIFYSTTFNSLNVQQARGRTNRKTSLHKCCYYYFLSTRYFPDRRIYRAIEENKTKEEIIIETAKQILDRRERY